MKICGISLPFNAKDIILGLTEHSSAQGIINNVLIILKYYIYSPKKKRNMWKNIIYFKFSTSFQIQK